MCEGFTDSWHALLMVINYDEIDLTFGEYDCRWYATVRMLFSCLKVQVAYCQRYKQYERGLKMLMFLFRIGYHFTHENTGLIWNEFELILSEISLWKRFFLL